MSVLMQTVQTSDFKSVDCSLMTLSVGFHDPSLHRSLVHAGQQGTPSRSNAYNRRHAYARPQQPSLETRTSNMPASTCQHIDTWQVSTTDKTRRQISKPEQPNGPPYVALQYSKVSCRRTHSCRSETLKHAALLKHASRCKQRKHTTSILFILDIRKTNTHKTVSQKTFRFVIVHIFAKY